MSSSKYFFVPDEAEGFRQGDILIRQSDLAIPGDSRHWYIVLTADCDIVQNKFDGHLTCVTVTTARQYLDSIYLAQTHEKALLKETDELATRVCTIDRQRDPEVEPLESTELHRWLNQRDVEGLSNDLHVTGKERCLLVESALKVTTLLAGLSSDRADSLLRYWKLTKKKPTSIQKELKSVLQKELSQDRFFIPALPAESEVGFVIHFRKLETVPLGKVLPSLYAARGRALDGDTFLRTGRFSDRVRFAIAQRAMLIFSRIGLNAYFEIESDAAAEIVCDQYGTRYQSMGKE